MAKEYWIMTKTWLDRLCDPLEHPKYPQIKGILVEKDSKDNVIGKCAEGEIACQNGIVLREFTCCLPKEDLIKLGIPSDLTENILPSPWDYVLESYDIGDYIIGLNDNDYSYAEIVEFLRTTFEDAV